MGNTQRRTIRAVKALAAALGGLVLLAALYVVVGNVLLVRGTVERMASKQPERFRLSYARASTFLPGRVHVQGLDLRGRNEHLEWQIHIDEADATLSLWNLLQRRIQVRAATARGVTVRLRLRLDPSQVDDDRVARLPPIEGFDRVPLLGTPVLPPQDRPPFVVEISDVAAADLREVWIDGFRLRGALAVQGGFVIGPGSRLDLLPSALQVEHASLTTGEDPIVTEVQGNLDARIDPVDLQENAGPLVLRYVTSHSTFRGSVGGIRFLRHFVDVEGTDRNAKDNPDAFSGGAGTFEGAVSLDHGVIGAGSRSQVVLEPSRVRFQGRSVDARVRLDTSVRSEDSGVVGEARAALTGVIFVEKNGNGKTASAEAITLTARAPETDLAQLPRDLAYAWDAPHLEVHDLHALDAYLPADSPFHVHGGAASVASHGEGTREALTVTGTVTGNPSFRAFGAGVAALLESAVHLRAHFTEGSLDFSGSTVTLRNPSINGGSADSGWSGSVTMPRALVATEAATDPKAPSFQATFDTRCRDARPLLSFFGAMQGSSPVVGTALGLVPEPLVDALTRDVHGGTTLRASKGELVVHQLALKGAASELHAEFAKEQGRTSGGMLIEAGPSSFGIAFGGGGASPVLFDAPGWYAREVAHSAR